MFGIKGLYNFVNEESLEGDSLIIGKFKLLTDELVDGILDIVNNTKGRTFIYFTVSQETLPLIEVRFTAFQKLKLLKKSKIVIVKPFVNDLTSAGAKKYVSYIPDIILRIYETYPTADIKNLQCELQEYTVKDLLTDAISKYEKFPEKKKTVKTMKELNLLSKRLAISDEQIKSLLQHKTDFANATSKLDLLDSYDTYKEFYNTLNESISYKDLNKQYIRDEFVLFTVMRNTSKLLYKSINVIAANFDVNEDDPDDCSLVDLTFDVPKNNPFCRIGITNLLSEPDVEVTNLREINLDDAELASDLRKFLSLLTNI